MSEIVMCIVRVLTDFIKRYMHVYNLGGGGGGGGEGGGVWGEKEIIS